MTEAEYLELPPLVRTRYEERLVLCRQAWETSQDPQAAAQAISWVFCFCQFPPRRRGSRRQQSRRCPRCGPSRRSSAIAPA